MPIFSSPRRPVLLSTLFVSALLTGCSGVNSTPAASATPLAVGNWQISSSETAAVKLPSLSGELSGSAGSIKGILHSQSAASCSAPANALEVSGAADSKGNVTLKGALAGGTLTITGTLASDGKSLESAQYTVTGGTCAFAKAADATAQSFSPISGTYSGTFTDTDGQSVMISATLQQSANSDGSGNYTLTGTATPNNPCFAGAGPVTATQVSGQMFSFTYTDTATGNSVVANGTFNSGASTLNVTSWQSSGNCGADSGTGSMSVQSPS